MMENLVDLKKRDEMKKFNEAYLHILYESKGFIPFNKDEYKEFLKSITKIDKNGNIISEDKDLLIDVPEELITYLFQHSNEFIKGDKFKSLLKTSKHWRNLKNIEFNDMFFGLFDFNKDSDIDKFHFNYFDIPIEFLEIARNDFKENIQNLFGFFRKCESVDLLCTNIKCDNIYNVMYHELSHFIQQYGKIRIVKEIDENKINKNYLESFFGVDYDKVISYFSNTEFVPHIDDLIKMLEITKEKFYKNIPSSQFFNDVEKFLCVKNKDEMLRNEFFLKFENANNGNVDSLVMLLFSFKSKFKFQKIYDRIKSYFCLK